MVIFFSVTFVMLLHPSGKAVKMIQLEEFIPKDRGP